VSWLDDVSWDANGLVPVIAQEHDTGRILMFAWMNREALQLTNDTQQAVYWSRSRNKLWRKGEESGHVQRVHEIRLDCDEDVILIIVEQVGGIACHTGRHNCFFKKLENDEWLVDQPVIKNPEEIYMDQKRSIESLKSE
jgi:phosphoribosyl-AMP cyclohydrolase